MYSIHITGYQSEQENDNGAYLDFWPWCIGTDAINDRDTLAERDGHVIMLHAENCF